MTDRCWWSSTALEEMRRRLLIVGGCWLALLVPMLALSGSLFRWLAAPLRHSLKTGEALVFLSATEPLQVYFQVAAVAALILCLPLLFWQLWGLVTTISRPRSPKIGLAFILGGSLSFLGGTLFGFHAVFPTIFQVLLEMGHKTGDLQPMLSMAGYLSLAVKMALAFGLVFDLPVLMMLLVHTGLADSGWFRARRKPMLIVAFVFGAVASPGPDVLSQCSLAVPFVLLYEIGILGSRLTGRRSTGTAAFGHW